MTKINNLETKVIILQTAVEIYRNGMAHIYQAVERVPNPMGINDLDKICTELNRIREIISLTDDTLDGLIDYKNASVDKEIYESADNLLKSAAEGEL